MISFLTALSVALFVALLVYILKSKRLSSELQAKDVEVANLMGRHQAELANVQADAERGLDDVRRIAQQERELEQKVTEDLRAHLQAEALRIHQECETQLSAHEKRLEALARFEPLANEEEEVRHSLQAALEEARSLRAQAEAIVRAAGAAAEADRRKAAKDSEVVYARALAVLDQANLDAHKVLLDADRRAAEIGGEAYLALKDRKKLEAEILAMENVITGYGDRYIIPTRSLLDDLAKEFGHLEAGQALALARDRTRKLVEDGTAATCAYVEASRRDTAIRFVVDAFNGRVDAILSRVRHDNVGILTQEIQDAFALVNLNGQAFRNAEITSLYLDARLAELRWAVIAQELRLKEREEQRALKEKLREEDRARREYERAIQEAQRDEQRIREAMAKARAEAEQSTIADRTRLEAQIALLNQQLTDAEARNQRAISMAQQTRAGHVYIISNIGSFGENVFKIGLTRRLDPLDRIKELGDASVPFEFDVHALIRSDDAPALESLLHHAFDDLRLNKVNFRKEYFRVPLNRIREVLDEKGLEASFTMLAEAREYRETQAIERMSPEERQRYYDRHADEDGGGD
jgi:T5orf172 domain/Domain of unknown function (DUF4041)